MAFNPVPGQSNMRTLLSCGGRFILPSSGSFAANGALSGITALRQAYANCWMNFPAGALFAGSLAGTYFAQMGSTTTATVFLNQPVVVDNTIPYPTNPIPIVAAGPGAYAQTTGTNLNVVGLPMQAGILGPNGRLRMKGYFSNNNSAGAKSGGFGIQGSTGVGIPGTSNTTNQFSVTEHELVNQAVTNLQVTSPASGYAVAAAAPIESTIDTTIPLALLYQLNIAVATDWCMWDWILAEVYQSN